MSPDDRNPMVEDELPTNGQFPFSEAEGDHQAQLSYGDPASNRHNQHDNIIHQ